ncbi:MAG: hypothetical protein IK096_01005, partial [Lachnospiraceae bacterium]|nr:hypothetical protein [Lachnospiraceae bacterium]
MKKQITKIITILTMALLGALLLSACARKKNSTGSFDALKDKLSKQQEEALNETKPGEKEEAAKNQSASDAPVNVDLDSEEEILKFLAGDWTFLDRETGEDFATLSISADGSITFTRLSDKKSSDGRIAFEPRYAATEGMPMQFRLTLDDITE